MKKTTITKAEAIKAAGVKQTAKNAAEAWAIANSIFPAPDYEYNSELSNMAGYPVYYPTSDNYGYSHICDLNTRLEVVFEDYSTINIYIEDEPEAPEAEAPENDENEWIKEYGEKLRKERNEKTNEVVIVVTNDSGSRRFSYDDLIDNIRFFGSSGHYHSWFEPMLENAISAMKATIDDNGFSFVVEFNYGGNKYRVMNGIRYEYSVKYGN